MLRQEYRSFDISSNNLSKHRKKLGSHTDSFDSSIQSVSEALPENNIPSELSVYDDD